MEVVKPTGSKQQTTKTLKHNATPVGFEPTRGDPIGLAGRRLSHSAKVSMSAGDAHTRFVKHAFVFGESEGVALAQAQRL